MEPLKITNPIDYKVALYIRLSKEDEKPGESQSISNQRSMLQRFAKKERLYVVDEYIDDGISGTTFERPGFKRLIRDIENGRVNMVITKDLSRLGRDYIQTGYYLEKYFPENRVRYISILDNVDTGIESSSNDITPFKSILNDMYAKDVSKRITTAFESCMERGSVLGSTPYGYDRIKDDNGYRLVIDEPAAEIVRKIFAMAKSGMSHRAIAGELTRSGVRTPEGYRQTGLATVLEGEPLSEWKNGTISQILSNEAYIGNLLQGKTKRCLYQGLDKQRVSKEEWIVHENAHEPIISKVLFDEVRNVVDKKKEKKSFAVREDLPLTPDKYKGILKCSVCGENMPRESAIMYSENGDVRQYYYRCRHGHLSIEEREGKSKVMISEEQLDLLVFASVQKAVKELAPDKKKLFDTLEQSLQPVDTKLQERITDLKKQKERLEYEGSLSYGSYVKGEITREELQLANEKQAEAVKNLEKKLLQAEKDYRNFLRNKREQKQFVNALLSVKEKSVVTPELIRMLISEIVLTPQRCMEIKYRFGHTKAGYTDVFQYPRKTKWNEGGRSDV